MPQLCVGEDEAKEDEVGEEGDDADDQDDQANPWVQLQRQGCHKMRIDRNVKVRQETLFST